MSRFSLTKQAIEDLRLPLEFYADGTLKSELFAERAHVQPDTTIAASGIVFRVFDTNGMVDLTITAQDAECSREQQAGWSDKSVSIQKGDMLVTGKGFKWSGSDGTMRILRQARVSFPSELIKTERILENDEKRD